LENLAKETTTSFLGEVSDGLDPALGASGRASDNRSARLEREVKEMGVGKKEKGPYLLGLSTSFVQCNFLMKNIFADASTD